MSQAVLDFNVEPVRRSLAREAAVVRTLCDNFEACHENISDVAQSAGKGEQVDVCKAALREILALQAEAKAYAGALEGLSQSYQASLGDTKFAEQIEQRKQLIEQQNPYSAMRDPVYTAFVRDLEARNGDGAVSAGDEDEDVAVVNTQGQVAKNAKCPITGRPVLELEEPVEDELGYVYEKAGILGYINTETHKHPGRPVLCPMAATRHALRKDKLRRAHRVIKEQKRLRRGGAAQGAGDAAEEVLDV